MLGPSGGDGSTTCGEECAINGLELELLRRYEAGLKPAHPTAGALDVTIIGYGEISAVLRFADVPDRIFKRMAGFISDAEVRAFVDVIERYCATLAERGVDVLETQCVPVETERNGRVVYLVQPALPVESIGNSILRDRDEATFRAMFRAVLDRLADVYRPNTGDQPLHVGIDAQISNWSWLPDGDGTHRLQYIDVGAPFMRRGGQELMNWDVIVRALPGPLRWYFQRFEQQGVLDRYYQLDKVLTDLAGNFIKEGRADRIAAALEEIDRWAHGSAADLGVGPPDPVAVERYYDDDARIWALVLRARKIDRFVQTHLLRRRYAHILPGKIKRR